MAASREQLSRRAASHLRWAAAGSCQDTMFCDDLICGTKLRIGLRSNSCVLRDVHLQTVSFCDVGSAVAGVLLTECSRLRVLQCLPLCSKKWASAPRGHPDPEGFHLKVVATVLKAHLEGDVGVSLFGDVGMFWDFGSLYQNPRLDNQEDLFKMELTASNIWYGSSQSTVWTGSQCANSYRPSSRLAPTLCDVCVVSAPFALTAWRAYHDAPPLVRFRLMGPLFSLKTFAPARLPSRGARRMWCVHNQGVHNACVQRSEQFGNNPSRGASSSPSDVG